VRPISGSFFGPKSTRASRKMKMESPKCMKVHDTCRDSRVTNEAGSRAADICDTHCGRCRVVWTCCGQTLSNGLRNGAQRPISRFQALILPAAVVKLIRTTRLCGLPVFATKTATGASKEVEAATSPLAGRACTVAAS
jgi:hypothetical protein